MHMYVIYILLSIQNILKLPYFLHRSYLFLNLLVIVNYI